MTRMKVQALSDLKKIRQAMAQRQAELRAEQARLAA